jgi:hypothetical protein
MGGRWADRGVFEMSDFRSQPMMATAKEIFMFVMIVPVAAVVLGLVCSVVSGDWRVQ